MMFSMAANYWIGSQLASKVDPSKNKYLLKLTLLWFGIIFNLGLLGYYKYATFAAQTIESIAAVRIEMENIVLPLAISFYTFTQIAYLLDCYRNETKETDFLKYALFVTFFPHLIAGPIVHHKELIPQFLLAIGSEQVKRNIVFGMFLFTIGLGKKVLIADNLAYWATAGFDLADTLNFWEAWMTSLSYTFQIYFDFSGYTDMALGAALMFNVRMPINFNSPYRSLSIKDFWRRWHISLSRFLREYVYVPLGGNRKGYKRMHLNVLATFALGGLWHGAAWSFVLWGLLHGMALLVESLWSTTKIRIPRVLAWIITFNFVNITWIFFRAKDMETVEKVLFSMFDISSVINGMYQPTVLESLMNGSERLGKLAAANTQIWMQMSWLPILLIISFTITQSPKNSTSCWLGERAWSNVSKTVAVVYGLVMLTCLVAITASSYTEFIYYNF
jgi:D-alanyl-lipoteichoic acid acyltransferase DltB (MBOAT superfamily)